MANGHATNANQAQSHASQGVSTNSHKHLSQPRMVILSIAVTGRHFGHFSSDARDFL